MSSSKSRFDLRKNYPLIFELGLIGALLIFIFAFKFQLPVQKSSSVHDVNEDEPPIILSPITIQKKPPPPPILPYIPKPVPNDDPIDAPDIEFPDFDDPGKFLTTPPVESNDGPEIFEQVEIMPSIKGGIQTLYSDVTYPELAVRNGIEGIVEVQFVVNTKGKAENPVIIRGIGAGCDEEVIKAIKLQNFVPGIQNGKFVNVRMKQVVHFRLKK